MRSKVDDPKLTEIPGVSELKSAGELPIRSQSPLEFIGTKRVARILFLSIAIAIFYAWFSAPMAARYFFDIGITATAKRTSPQAMGAQVWMLSPNIEELRSRNVDVRISEGWKRGNNVFYFENDYAGQLRIRGYFSPQDSIILLKHQWSGEVEIEINGISNIVDLYQDQTAFHTVVLQDYLPESKSFSLATLLEDVFRCGKYILLVFSSLILFFPIYRLLPEPVPGRSNESYALNADRAIPGMKRKLLLLIAVAWGTFAVFLIAFYPGVMTDDSYSQYREVIHSTYRDWHPPIMAGVWRITDKIVRGPGGMFLLHLGAAVYSVYLLSKVALENGKRWFAIPFLILFLPSISGILFVIWKDVSLATSLLLAFSLWFYFRSSGKLNRFRLLLVLCFLFYGACVRHNGLAAVLPLLFLFFYELAGKKKALAFSLAIIGLFYLGGKILNYHLLRAERSYIFQAIMADDLMAMYDVTNKNYFPRNYMTAPQLTESMKYFDPASIHLAEASTPFITSDSAAISDLRRNWLLAIQNHPKVYLHHRWIKFKIFLTDVVWVIQPISHEVPVDLIGTPNLGEETLLGRLHTALVYWLENHFRPLFQPIIYILLNCLITVLAIRRRVFPAAALNLSSLLYILPYFVVAPRSNYRFIYWPVIATSLSVFIFWIVSRSGWPTALNRKTKIGL